MQIEISQSRQFKYSIVYVVKDAISYNCFPSSMQHFVVKKCFYFKAPDGAASISSPSYCLLLFYILCLGKTNFIFTQWLPMGLWHWSLMAWPVFSSSDTFHLGKRHHYAEKQAVILYLTPRHVYVSPVIRILAYQNHNIMRIRREVAYQRQALPPLKDKTWDAFCRLYHRHRSNADASSS